ncbi:MAG: hypothetical protein JSW50_08585 [Candidatus Latescibacterota bacterium]|nr:MAG: hypothetical protein JSW50_08585 [Candidatus Latescibacterota bacterium]
MNWTTTTITITNSVRTWSPPAGSKIGKIRTVGFGIADLDRLADTATGRTMSGPMNDQALSAATETPPKLAPAAESAKPPVVRAVEESRRSMGFGVRRTDSQLEGTLELPDERTGVVTAATAPNNAASLVGLEAGGVVHELGGSTVGFDEVLTDNEPGDNALLRLRCGVARVIPRRAVPKE